MEIELEQCTLRRWRQGDEQSLARHANNYKIWRNVRDRFPHPYTLEDAHGWISEASLDETPTNFAIVVDGAAVGGIGLIFHDDIHRHTAEIGYWLGEEFWGRGIVTEAVRAVSDWAFAHFDLRRIYAGVIEWNQASARVLEKAGFQFEGRMRKAVTKEGVTMDELLYALVRE
jgi:RimJ/RimL family protein N-acetyltransferase